MADPASPSAAGGDAAAQAANRQVQLQKIYIKDASIEVPGAPDIFLKNKQPQIDVNVGTQMKPLTDDRFDVQLTVTVTSKIDNDTAFLVEVTQGGIFMVKGFPSDAEKGAVLGGYCPSMLFPFAREAVADFVQKAGFPQLLLQPINFEALYLEHLKKQRAEAEQKKATEGGAAAPGQSH